MSTIIEPAAAAWQAVHFLDPYIWIIKGICALLVALGFMVLPRPVRRSAEYPKGMHPAMWTAVMWSRAHIIAGSGLLFLSIVTPITAFGPLGDIVFWPAFTINMGLLVACQRAHIWRALTDRPTPEAVVIRSLIAGRKT